jgi:hypothetical protein
MRAESFQTFGFVRKCYILVMPQSAVDLLTNMGLPGLVILFLMFLIKKQDDRTIVLQSRIDSLQNQRVDDAQKLAAGVATLGEALDRQSEKLDAYLERKLR